MDQVPCWTVETTNRDVVCFQENTWHAAFGGWRGRLQNAISFHSAPRDDAELDFIRGLIDAWNFGTHPHPKLRASSRPRIQDMIRVPLALGAPPPKTLPVFVCETDATG
jgi:hypothetical protein